jgi:penicillin V acylase-like amidase (Ntn superfamily)
MNTNYVLIRSLGYLALILCFLMPAETSACSTFKLQKGDSLVYGHNLNQGDIDVPGLIFLNKRGVFKTGRTWSELITREQANSSTLCWISRYGSATFNVFGIDLPDGGMNEAGLYIWEMNADFDDYPKNDSLPKLNHMHWMQYILDNYSTVEEAVQCANEIELDGWGWHYFVGDIQGNTAAIDFVDNRVVVNTGENMPVPGLFNTNYNRELEILKYYRGFGGLYEPDLNDPEVQRFVKTAVLVRDYNPAQKIVDYGLDMLQKLQVYDVPEWSVLFDARNRDVYFRTRINPEIKHFSMNMVDFSNASPVQILNIDVENGGNVFDLFRPYGNDKMREFTRSSVFPILPEGFFTRGGLTLDEYLERISTHADAAASEQKQFFRGVWQSRPDTDKKENEVTLKLETKGNAVYGRISLSGKAGNSYPIEHIHLIDHDLKFTFRKENNVFVEVQASIEGEKMNATLYGDRRLLGSYLLFRKD